MELDASFEAELEEALLDDAEDTLYNDPGNLAFEFLDTANENLRGYGRIHGYDVDSIAESGKVVSSSRSGNSVSVKLEWDHEAAGLMETGTSRHTVRGEPLAFEWPDAPADVREKFAKTFPTVFFTKVEVSGIPAARFVRKAGQSLRATLQRRGAGGRFE